LERVLLEARFDDLEGAVEDPLRRRLLAAGHQGVREFGNELVPVDRIGKDLSLWNVATARHLLTHPFGRFTPYFERLRLRFALFVLEGPEAPEASSVPRTT